MELSVFLKEMSADDRGRFAKKCGTSYKHLINVAHGYNGKVAGENLAMMIEIESGGKVTAEELRPDLKDQWAYMRSTGCNCKIGVS